MPRECREARMSPAVTAWLEARGLVVYAEVPFHSSLIDLVGIKPDGEQDEHVAVEMSMSLAKRVIYQAMINLLCTQQSYCAIPTRPRPGGLEQCRKLGVGVLRLVAGKVAEALAPVARHNARAFPHYDLARKTAKMELGGTGGLPFLRGEGPAQDCLKRVNEYRASRPGPSWSVPTWREIFRAVPNHYSTHTSLAQCMRKVEERLAERARRDRLDNLSVDLLQASQALFLGKEEADE